MKKIMFVMSGLSDGGAERVASILANNLSSRGYKIVYLCMYNDIVDYHVDPKINVINSKVKGSTFVSRFIKKNLFVKKMIKKEKPDVILSFLLYEIVFASFCNKRIVYSLRNDPHNTDNNGIFKMLRSFILKRAKRIVFQSEAAKKFFSTSVQKKSIVIFNPIQVENMPMWYGEQSKTFVSLSRLTKQKNITMMIDCFVHIHSKYNEYELNIYGKGEEFNYLRNYIDNLCASDYIHLKGRTSCPLNVLSNSFAFLSSSNYEGLSNSMLEALCVGVPCICTNCPPGSAADFVKDGYNGYLTITGNAEEFENAICRVINGENHFCLKESSLACRERLNKDSICSAWEQVLLEVCDGRC